VSALVTFGFLKYMKPLYVHVPFPLWSVCLWQHCIGSFLLASVEVLVIDMCLPELFSRLKVSMQHTNMSQCFEDVA
jgi:hypothetical protein